jgi:hypothetical protein
VAVSLKHKFESAKADGLDSTKIQPSNWNDEHDLLMATSRVLGRLTAGTGPAEELTVDQLRPVIGGSKQWLARRTLSGLTNIDFTEFNSSLYAGYEFDFQNAVITGGSGGNSLLSVLMSSNGGSSYDSGATNYANIRQTVNSSGTFASFAAQETSSVALGISGFGFSGTVKLYAPDAVNPTVAHYKFTISSTADSSVFYSMVEGSGVRLAASVINAIRFSPSAGTWTGGFVDMYGLRKAA